MVGPRVGLTELSPNWFQPIAYSPTAGRVVRSSSKVRFRRVPRCSSGMVAEKPSGGFRQVALCGSCWIRKGSGREFVAKVPIAVGDTLAYRLPHAQ